MIRILIENKHEVYLYADTKLRFEVNSTLFNSEAVPGSIVYPFNIPVFKNESIFQNSHFIEVNKRLRLYNVSFYFFGYLPFSGTLVLKKIDKKNYKGSIIVNTFSVGFKDVKLNQLEYPDITIGGSPHASTNVAFHAEQIVKGNIDADYNFPAIFAELFYGDLDDDTDEAEFNKDWGGDDGGGSDAGKIINNYNAAAGTFPVNTTHEDPSCDNVYAMVPFPFLVPLVHKVFDKEGYYVFGDFIDDAEINDLIIFNNYPLDEKRKRYFVRASQTSAQTNIVGEGLLIFPDDSSGDNEDEDGIFNTTLSEYTLTATGYHQVICDVDFENFGGGTLMQTSIKLYIDSSLIETVSSNDLAGHLTLNNTRFYDAGDIGKELTIYAEFREYDETWVDCSGEIENGVLSVMNTSYNNLNQFSNKLNLADHLPSIKIETFLNAIRKAFGLALYYNFSSKEIEISFSKDVLSLPGYIDLTDVAIDDISEIELSVGDGFTFGIDYHRKTIEFGNYEYLGEYATFSDLPQPKEVNITALVKNTNVIYIFRSDPDTNEISWFYFSDNFYNVVIDNGKTKIKPSVSTLAMGSGNDKLGCQTKIIASSAAFETGTNEFPFILMFDRGLQEDADSNDYPMSSCVNLDLDGNSIGNYTMLMNGDDGLYNKFLKPWYDFIQNAEKVRKRFDCDVAGMMDIINLFQPQRGNKTRKCRVGNINFIPSKFSFILSNKGIEQTEGILYKQGEVEI